MTSTNTYLRVTRVVITPSKSPGGNATFSTGDGLIGSRNKKKDAEGQDKNKGTKAPVDKKDDTTTKKDQDDTKRSEKSDSKQDSESGSKNPAQKRT